MKHMLTAVQAYQRSFKQAISLADEDLINIFEELDQLEEWPALVGILDAYRVHLTQNKVHDNTLSNITGSIARELDELKADHQKQINALRAKIHDVETAQQQHFELSEQVKTNPRGDDSEYRQQR